MSSNRTRSAQKAIERVTGAPSLLLMVTVMIPAFSGETASQSQQASCPMSLAGAAARSGGAVLIQSASVRERLGMDTSSENAPLLPQSQRRPEASAAPRKDTLNQFAMALDIPLNFSMASLLQYETLRTGLAFSNSAAAKFHSWYGLGVDSTLPLIFALVALLAIIGVMYWLANPPPSVTRTEFVGPRDGPSLTSDMLTRAKYDARAYASSSAMVVGDKRQVPVERSMSCPQVGNTPTPVINVPRGRTPPRPGSQGQASRNQALQAQTARDLSGDARRMSAAMSSAPPSARDEPTRFDPRASTAGLQFCPELIVPQHCECILLVPLLADQYSSFEVTDCNGSCVLRVVPQAPTAGRLWRATITSGNGELLAQCCEASYQASSRYAPEFHLLQAGGQLWAKLLHTPNQERYVVNFVNGGVLHFWGNFDENAVNITNETNQLLATTEVGSADFDPDGKYYRLRVAPTADVGLAVCGLLCIGQHMTKQRRANASI